MIGHRLGETGSVELSGIAWPITDGDHMLQLIMSKWVGGLLLPPLNLLGLAGIGLWIARRRRWGAYLCAGSLLLLALLATPWLSSRLLHAMETAAVLQPPFQHGAQAIVVLGGGVYDHAPEFGGPSLTVHALQRLHYAAWLQRQTGLPLLVTGGSPNSHVAEGEVMAMMLRRDFGLQVRWVESRALDTVQNADYSARLLRPHGIHTVYVISQAWHLPRALPQFERQGLHAIAAPVGFTRPVLLNPLSLLPSGYGLLNSYLASHEAVGRVAYAIRDQLGGNSQ